jgi:hypothetical protein
MQIKVQITMTALLVTIVDVAGCGTGAQSVCEEAMDHMAGCGLDTPLNPETCDADSAAEANAILATDCNALSKRGTMANAGYCLFGRSLKGKCCSTKVAESVDGWSLKLPTEDSWLGNVGISTPGQYSKWSAPGSYATRGLCVKGKASLEWYQCTSSGTWKFLGTEAGGGSCDNDSWAPPWW